MPGTNRKCPVSGFNCDPPGREHIRCSGFWNGTMYKTAARGPDTAGSGKNKTNGAVKKNDAFNSPSNIQAGLWAFLMRSLPFFPVPFFRIFPRQNGGVQPPESMPAVSLSAAWKQKAAFCGARDTIWNPYVFGLQAKCPLTKRRFRI